MPYNPYYQQMPYNNMMPYQQPMQDRLAQLQNQYQNTLQQTQQPIQMQYIQQQPQMVGRYVNDFSEITANDVPMDGKWAIFAKNDMSEIQARAWSPNGTIVPVSFKPVAQETKEIEDTKEDYTKAFMKRFDDISERLDKMEKAISRQASVPSKTKKEVSSDE